MGATLGNLEFSSQTNQNADSVPKEWVDDLTIMEIINLVSIVLCSYNFKQHVASDIPNHGQYISNQDLKSQTYLAKINHWTENQKMQINQKKTKEMIINFTDKYQFTSSLELKGQVVQ